MVHTIAMRTYFQFLSSNGIEPAIKVRKNSSTLKGMLFKEYR